MKSMTCRQLGGACDLKFSANSFEEIADQSKKHGREMFQKGDQAHTEKMNEMRTIMQSPDAMKNWFESKRQEFNNQSED